MSTKKSPGRILAERIVANHGTIPQIITAPFVGKVDVEVLIAKLLQAHQRAHEHPVKIGYHVFV